MEDQITSTPRYEPGERVTVTLAGVRITDVVEQRTIIVDLGNEYYVAVPLGGGVDVERVSPVGGPILAGDIWKDRFGGRWFASGSASGSPRMVSQDGSRAESVEYLVRYHSPLNIVYREEPEHDECRGAIADAAADAASRYTHPAVGDCDDACADEREAAGTCRHTDGDDL